MREVFNDINQATKYTTRRKLVIDSYLIGAGYRIVQLLVVIFFIAYVFVSQERYKYTNVYPIHLSTNIVGSQVLLDSDDKPFFIEAMDITSPDLYVSDSINFGVKVVKSWQKRTICKTNTQCKTDADGSSFLSGSCQDGFGSAFEWCTINSQSFTVDKLDNFYLEILGVAGEMGDDDDDEGLTNLDSGFNSTYGYAYGVNLISISDLLKQYNANITANDITK